MKNPFIGLYCFVLNFVVHCILSSQVNSIVEIKVLNISITCIINTI